MRGAADKTKIEKFMHELGAHVRGRGRVYVTGGTTAVLEGWRERSVDVDIKADPEPAGFFEAIANLKDRIDVNVELASPDDFIPELPGWRERSRFIAKHGDVEFFHYDLYSQALSKIQRGHARDKVDVAKMVETGLVDQSRLLELFGAIEPELIRYPAIERKVFRDAVVAFCESKPEP